jgi:hypothetical protein
MTGGLFFKVMVRMEKSNNSGNDPIIIRDRDKDKSYYGGNQEWFESNTRAYAGCGSVACANMLRILAQKYPDDFKKAGVSGSLNLLTQKDFYKDDFLKLMSGIYGSMLVFETPLVRRLYDSCRRGGTVFKRLLIPSFGMSINGFIRGTLKYCRKNGLMLHAHSLPTAYCTYEKGLDFIKEGLKSSGSVVIMTSLNRHPLKLYSGAAGSLDGGYDSKNGVKSHFMTITGLIYEKEGEIPLIRFSTWGRIATVPYDRLHASWQKIGAYTSCLYYFTPVSSEAVVRADIRNSAAVFPKALLTTLLGLKNRL